jgi:hypothetical protein
MLPDLGTIDAIDRPIFPPLVPRLRKVILKLVSTRKSDLIQGTAQDP